MPTLQERIALAQQALDQLAARQQDKQAFVPMPGGTDPAAAGAVGMDGAPMGMDPSMMGGGGGAPMGGAPMGMDPSVMGMDPSMMGGGGGAPPTGMDPSMMGMDPSMMVADPSVMGGAGAPAPAPAPAPAADPAATGGGGGGKSKDEDLKMELREIKRYLQHLFSVLQLPSPPVETAPAEPGPLAAAGAGPTPGDPQEKAAHVEDGGPDSEVVETRPAARLAGESLAGDAAKIAMFLRNGR